MTKASTNFWLAVGTPENWHTAFDYGEMWGLKASQQRFWEAISENSDIVFFYVTSPVSGVVGYGIVRTKLRQNSPKWPEERATNRVIWPLRFEFEVLACLPPNKWSEERVMLEALKTRARSGFQGLERAIAEQIIRALPSNVPEGLVVARHALPGQPLPAPVPSVPGGAEDPHARAQSLLAEIGRLQRFLADTEYPLENRRLDVVWRRVERSVPSYVFEVQVSGNLTEAMSKLKQAFDLWNSNILLVAKPEHRSPVSQLADGAFREIRNRLRFLEIPQIEELYQRKRSYHELEKELGIFS